MQSKNVRGNAKCKTQNVRGPASQCETPADSGHRAAPFLGGCLDHQSDFRPAISCLDHPAGVAQPIALIAQPIVALLIS